MMPIAVQTSAKADSRFKDVKTAEAMADMMMSLAKHAILEVGELRPTAFFLTPTKVHMAFSPGFESPQEKDLFGMMLRQMAQTYGAEFFGLMMEAWMLTAPKETTREQIDEAYKKYGSIQNMPGRAECVTVVAESKLSAKSRVAEIQRDKKGRIKRLLENGTMTSGAGEKGARFMGILYVPKIPPLDELMPQA